MKTNRTENISLLRYVFYGLNIIFGLTFLISIGQVYENSGDWMFLLFILGGVIVFMVGVIYAYLSRHMPNAKGGIYAYAKSAIGYRAAFFFNWCQYIVSPTLLAGETISVVLAFSNLPWYHEYKWLIFLVSVVIFIGISLLLVFGLHSTKIMIIFLTVAAYSSMAFFIGSTLARIGHGFFGNIFSSSSRVNISLPGLISSFYTFFFALGGIEYLAAGSNELKNREKNASRGIFITMVVTLGGYFLLTLLTKAALGPSEIVTTGEGLNNNPINKVLLLVFGAVGGTAVIYIFAVIKVLSESNARLNIGWLSARVIEPMAEDGFLPTSWAKRNKHNQLQMGIIWHSIITFVLLAAILVPLYLYPGNQAVTAAFQIYSLIAFIQYIGVAWCGWKLIERKKIPYNATISFIAPVLIVILVVCTALYLYSSITNGVNGDVSQWISLGASVGSLLLAIPVYYLGKWLGYHAKGWKSNKVIKIEHDQEHIQIYEEIDSMG